MTKAQIMKRAHEIARTLEGDYRARMSIALCQTWAEAKISTETTGQSPELKGVITMKEQIKEIVEKYKLYEPNTKKGMIAAVSGAALKKNKADFDFIKANKVAFLEYLREEKAAEERRIEESAKKEREWKVSIGLDKLEAAINEQLKYKAAFDKAWKEGNGRYPTKPEDHTAEIAKLYPIAAAYRKAESWSHAAHYCKALAGEAAKERIRNGEDYKQAIADMERKWSEYCKQHSND